VVLDKNANVEEHAFRRVNPELADGRRTRMGVIANNLFVTFITTI
jgi:hypothetical protein